MAFSLRLASRSRSRTSHLQTSRAQMLAPRSFTTTTRLPSQKKEVATNRVKKGDTLDVQSDNAKAGMDANKSSGGGSGGGNATARNDSQGGKDKAKKEFPEAPDTIGMQDERGGKGG